MRPNTVLALGSRDGRPDYDHGDGVTLAVYELSAGHACTVTVPTVTGEPDMTFHVRREADALIVQRTGSAKLWSLLLVGVDAVGAIEGGAAISTPDGVRVMAVADQDELRIVLARR